VVVETHLRSDAQRNLERILGAARAIFAERGLDASVADVAARAGVGTATIFRRFPTKDDLLAAVLESELNTLVAQVEQAGSVAELMRAMIERFVSVRCLCEVAGSELLKQRTPAALKERIVSKLAELLRREQDAGAIRRDITVQDIEVLVHALGQAGISAEQTTPGSWRRYVDVVLAGLRPT
jgi:AcrR family transcriptional regulator